MLRKVREMLQCQKGFTLVELMAVIAIIGILAAIAVPKFMSATDEAAISKIQADLRTIDSAIAMHYAANSTYPADVAALATAGYLQAEPVPPTGWGTAYTLNAAGDGALLGTITSATSRDLITKPTPAP